MATEEPVSNRIETQCCPGVVARAEVRREKKLECACTAEVAMQQ